ncbi:MAG: nitroreductase family protein [Bacteroidales bacterium]|jgi:nitroreductase
MNAKKIIKKNTKTKISEVSLKDLKPIRLIKPKHDNGISVMKALKRRKTIREISDRKISLQMLSDLLWAACGVNRKKGPFGIPGRTAATASNSQEIDLYVAMEEATYFYDCIYHRLIPVAAGDLRKLAIGYGQSGFGDKAPVRLIFVADIDRLVNTKGFREPGLADPEVQKSYYFADTGLIAGNVYLFAASRGLASWFHNCSRKALAEKLNLSKDHRVLFGQTVGYPVK